MKHDAMKKVAVILACNSFLMSGMAPSYMGHPYTRAEFEKLSDVRKSEEYQGLKKANVGYAEAFANKEREATQLFKELEENSQFPWKTVVLAIVGTSILWAFFGNKLNHSSSSSTRPAPAK